MRQQIKPVLNISCVLVVPNIVRNFNTRIVGTAHRVTALPFYLPTVLNCNVFPSLI